jgi:Zn-dependent peptidase ImmA (M78 family)
LGINIIPVPGLIDFHVDAYTWGDMENIVVDKFFYDKQSRRYRFTLAHEMGHIILHAEILKRSQVASVEEYLDFVNDIGEEAHRWTEWQADCFAGLVLVPAGPLVAKLHEASKMANEKGLSEQDVTTRGYIADWISDFFEVSAQTIETRLVYDGLWERAERKKQR